MPIYEYYCKHCDKIIEIEQSISDNPLTICPECGKNSFKRLISNTTFMLKGSGWYKDGYAESSGSNLKSSASKKKEKKTKEETKS